MFFQCYMEALFKRHIQGSLILEYTWFDSLFIIE